MPLIPVPVALYDDIEHFRVIRNSGRDMFPTRVEELSQTANIRWWRLHMRNMQAYIYKGVSPPHRVVGVGALQRKSDGRLWEFLGVYPEFKGQGYATEILQHLLSTVKENVWTEINLKNKAALRINEKVGGWTQALITPNTTIQIWRYNVPENVRVRPNS